MPRGIRNNYASNLSVLIPRSIHRMSRCRAIQVGAPSYAAYVAAVLEKASREWTEKDLPDMHILELCLKLTERSAS
jgi:hypothetical protein